MKECVFFQSAISRIRALVNQTAQGGPGQGPPGGAQMGGGPQGPPGRGGGGRGPPRGPNNYPQN